MISSLIGVIVVLVYFVVRQLARPDDQFKFGLWRYAALIVDDEVFYLFVTGRHTCPDTGPWYKCRSKWGEGLWIPESRLFKLG